ncbi:MAG: hypothetical protein GY847_30180 [Proteobacteria bacterium]|nr:hypothetical protein [Pseudomonadota bacterium]
MTRSLASRSSTTKYLFSSPIAAKNERYLLYMTAASMGIAYAPNPPFPDPDFNKLMPLLDEKVGRSINTQMFVLDVLKKDPVIPTKAGISSKWNLDPGLRG